MNAIAIVSARRTPFVRVASVLRRHRALELAKHAVDATLAAVTVAPDALDLLACGIVVVDPRIPHLAREVVLAGALPSKVRAVTLTDNCITGITAIEAVAHGIRSGRAEVGIAVGVESMSNPAILFTPRASRIFVDLAYARRFGERLRLLGGLRPRDFLPDPPPVAEPSTGLSMGEHCELMVKEWEISREEQDAIALASHRRAAAAAQDGRLGEDLAPMADADRDGLIRPDTSAERLARLSPVFDRSASGTITAGNSSPLTDGAAAVMLMSESRAARERVAPLAYVEGIEFASIAPADGLLMAPALAVPRLLRRLELSLDDIDLVEVHEAFAGQVACNLRAWREGWREPAIGVVDADRLNVAGGSIALGHPFAATGLRIAGSLAREMRRRGARRGLISVCGAGATAAAMVLSLDSPS